MLVTYTQIVSEASSETTIQNARLSCSLSYSFFITLVFFIILFLEKILEMSDYVVLIVLVLFFDKLSM